MGKKQQILKTQTKLEPDHDDPSWPEAPKNRAQTFFFFFIKNLFIPSTREERKKIQKCQKCFGASHYFCFHVRHEGKFFREKNQK